MSTKTTCYLDAIDHLPPGNALILTDVPWHDYERVLRDLQDSRSVRITYDRGRMEIMSPSQQHENLTEMLSRLAYATAEIMELEIESLGSTTYKQEWLSRGVEPDGSFYVQNALHIAGKRRIDLRTDAPPDVIVEIDIAHDSTSKLTIYAELRVPEIWRYDGKSAHIYHLSGNSYIEVSRSKALSMLTSKVLSQFLAQCDREGQSVTLRSFRKWLRDNHK